MPAGSIGEKDEGREITGLLFGGDDLEAYERFQILRGTDDDAGLAQVLLEDSKNDILSYCNLDELPDALIGLQVGLAVKRLNRMGTEGETSRSEGGVSHSFGDLIDEDAKKTLRAYRKMR